MWCVYVHPTATTRATGRFNRHARARGRHRTPATAIDGGVGRARARERVRSTGNSSAYPKPAAPLPNGHRHGARRQRRQWRTAASTGHRPRRRFRMQSRGGKGQVDAQAHHERHGEVGEARGGLTATQSTARSARVVAVNRQMRRGDGIPARVARRGRRGSRGARPCGSDWSAAARNDGNGSAS